MGFILKKRKKVGRNYYPVFKLTRRNKNSSKAIFLRQGLQWKSFSC
ncbi:hypothetical protein ACFP3I_11345 [Chryseobacterium arachidis]